MSNRDDLVIAHDQTFDLDCCLDLGNWNQFDNEGFPDSDNNHYRNSIDPDNYFGQGINIYDFGLIHTDVRAHACRIVPDYDYGRAVETYHYSGKFRDFDTGHDCTDVHYYGVIQDFGIGLDYRIFLDYCSTLDYNRTNFRS